MPADLPLRARGMITGIEIETGYFCENTEGVRGEAPRANARFSGYAAEAAQPAAKGWQRGARGYKLLHRIAKRRAAAMLVTHSPLGYNAAATYDARP
jgi:hypothetical protein